MRFIQVGVGGFGGVWQEVTKNNPQAEIVGLVDISPDSLKHACHHYGHKPDICYSTLKDALKHVKADAAIVVTPPKLHRPPVVEALNAGLHVISEKPMAEDMADCKAMLDASLKNKRIYMVSQNYRYHPEMWTVSNVVKSGRLGKVGQVKVDFFMGVWLGGFRQKMDYPLIVDMSIHHMDLIRFVTGADPVTVRADGWNPVWSNTVHDCSASAFFEMSNGSRVMYNGSWVAAGQFCDWNANWQIECEKGTIVYQKGKITIHHVGPTLSTLGYEDVVVQSPPKTDQAYVLDEFIRCVENKQKPATYCFDNIQSVAMVFATVKAMKTGKRVPVLDASVRKLIKGR